MALHVISQNTFSSSAKNISVTFDSHINLEKNVLNTCKNSFFSLMEYGKIQNRLSENEGVILVHAFISPKLDFCYAILNGSP